MKKMPDIPKMTMREANRISDLIVERDTLKGTINKK